MYVVVEGTCVLISELGTQKPQVDVKKTNYRRQLSVKLWTTTRRRKGYDV